MIKLQQDGLASVLIIILAAIVLMVGGLAAFKAFNSRQSPSDLLVAPPPSAGNVTHASGISGQVFCSQKIDREPCTAEIEVYPYVSGSDGANEPLITKVKTDSNGNYRVNLNPGSYRMVPLPKSGYVHFLPPLPSSVIVSAQQFTVVDITYHDGTK